MYIYIYIAASRAHGPIDYIVLLGKAEKVLEKLSAYIAKCDVPGSEGKYCETVV